MKAMSSEQRVLLAFALSFLVLVGWSYYMRAMYPPPPPVPIEEAAPASEAQPGTSPGATPFAASAPPERAQAQFSAGVTAQEIKQGTQEQFLTVESRRATVTFSTRGALITSWTLKEFRDDNGDPLELVNGADTGLGFPLEFELDDAGQQAQLNQAIFVTNALSSGFLSAPVELVFEWSDGNLTARKKVRFLNGEGEGYLAELETEVWAGGVPVPHRVAWRGGFGDIKSPSVGFVGQLLLRAPDGLQRHPAAQANEDVGWLFISHTPFPYAGEAAYLGLEDRYFAALFFPEDTAVRATAVVAEWTPEEDGKTKRIGSLAVGSPLAGSNRFRLYVGPKSGAALEAISAPQTIGGQPVELTSELVDYGWFWWVARPLFVAMKWLHDNVTGNYGWAIVLLTVLINAALFPMRIKTMQSAFKMQQVGPQVKQIQERYKKYKFNDPKRQDMQKEIMALYKREGVNPFGSCLPMLLQLPFFYGFFKVLSVSIELRQAPWFGWIHDLSQPDPYYILPIVMSVTMYYSMRLTPMTTTDPSQARMMRMMPFIFGFLFLAAQSGLVLYWLMSNLAGVVQQVWLNKRQAALAETEKRAAKELKKKKRRKGKPEAAE